MDIFFIAKIDILLQNMGILLQKMDILLQKWTFYPKNRLMGSFKNNKPKCYKTDQIYKKICYCVSFFCLHIHKSD